MLRIINMRVSLEDKTNVNTLAAKRLNLPPQVVLEVVIIRKALDARRKTNISFVYTLDVRTSLPEGQVIAGLHNDKNVSISAQTVAEVIISGEKILKNRPVIVGFGPAGMLAALTLAQYGYRPLILERGRNVEERTKDVAKFWQTGEFDEISNVQFGEGGAGTFSDGKLTTRVNDPLMRQVLDILVAAGAPPEITYLHKPHIGTDKLRGVVKHIRQEIIKLGGEVQFEAKVTDITIEDGEITELTINENQQIPCSVALFAIGHSARDTYTMLHNRGIAMEAKPFSIGVRIEHSQDIIDKSQYGISAGHANLSPADYALVYHAKDTGRTAYSFCMCPGGLVVAAASEKGGVVTNGMSLYNRASGISNSALVVNVTPEDFGNHVLGGMKFQRKYEQLAFQCGGDNYHAPIQTVGDFLAGKIGSTTSKAKPSYRPGTIAADLRQCLPEFVVDTLARALPDFDRKINGFAHPDTIMTGVEEITKL